MMKDFLVLLLPLISSVQAHSPGDVSDEKLKDLEAKYGTDVSSSTTKKLFKPN